MDNIHSIISSFKEYSSWIDTLKNVDDHIWKTPIAADKWSVREIIAHITNWDKYLLSDILPSIRRGEKISFPEFEPFNKIASDYAKSGVTKQDILNEAKDTRELLVKELNELPFETVTKHILVNEVTHCPHTGTPYSLLYVVQEFIDHDRHHQKQVQQFAQQNNLV
ncbi:DinB family protein [Fredinandcohnia humi]